MADFDRPRLEALADGERPDANSLDDAAPGIPSMDGNTRQPRKRTVSFMATSGWPRTSGVLTSFAAIARRTHVWIAFHLLHHSVPQPVRGPTIPCLASFARLWLSLLPKLLAPAGVAVFSTSLATTEQFARTWWCFGSPRLRLGECCGSCV